MPGKPYRSCLIPHEDEIMALRRLRPPVPYGQIAEFLRRKYQLTVCRETIFKFVKARSGGRKVYFFRRDVAVKQPPPVQPASPTADPDSRPVPKAKFQFTPSERYNLKRLPPEEAAAIRKKLEEEGH
jgi:hypothetical protein